MAQMQVPPPPLPTYSMWLGSPGTWTVEQQIYLLQGVATILTNQGALMASIADVKAAADQIATQESGLATTVPSLVTALQGLEQAFEQLKNNPANTITPADQANLDAAQQELTNASSDLANQLTNLQSATSGIPPTA